METGYADRGLAVKVGLRIEFLRLVDWLIHNHRE